MAEWTSEDWKLLKVRIGPDMVEKFQIIECQSQFPVCDGLDGLKPYGYFLQNHGIAPFEKATSSELIVERLEDEVVLKQYYHHHFDCWMDFKPELTIHSSASCLAFKPENQFLALGFDNKITVHSIHTTSVLLWESTIKSSIRRICWSQCGNLLCVLEEENVYLYTMFGDQIYEEAIRASDVCWTEHELVAVMEEGLYSFEFAKLQNISRPDFLLHNQICLFKGINSKTSAHFTQWETRSLSSSNCSVFDSYILELESNKIILSDVSKNTVKNVQPTFNVQASFWLKNGVLAVTGVKKNGSIILGLFGEDLLQIIELPMEPIYICTASMSNHLIMIFQNLTVHIYRIDRISSDQLDVEFALNISLGVFGPEKEAHRCPLLRWQVDLFEMSSLSSPSELDVNELRPRRVSIDNLVFLQGDRLYTVILRPASHGSSVAAVGIESDGVDFFKLIRCQSDLWLLTVHRAFVRLRKWPFRPEPDIHLPVNFHVTNIIHDRNQLAILMNVRIVKGHPRITESSSLGPVIAKHYLECNDFEKLVSLIRNGGDMILECVLVSLVEQSNRLKAAQSLSKLQSQCKAFMDKTQFYRALVRVARSIEASDAKWLFEHSAPIESVFEGCLAAKDLEICSMMLMLLLVHREDTSTVDFVCKLIETIMNEGKFELLKDLKHLLGMSELDQSALEQIIRNGLQNMANAFRWRAIYRIASIWFGNMEMNLNSSCGLSTEAKICAVFTELAKPFDREVLKKGWTSVEISTVAIAPAKASPTEDFIEFLRLVDNEEAALLWSLALGQQFTDADREREAYNKGYEEGYREGFEPAYQEGWNLACQETKHTFSELGHFLGIILQLERKKLSEQAMKKVDKLKQVCSSVSFDNEEGDREGAMQKVRARFRELAQALGPDSPVRLTPKYPASSSGPNSRLDF